MENVYTSGAYLESTRTWHVEDSTWKANQISRLLAKNDVHPKLVAEIGCGGGAILSELSQKPQFADSVRFIGYDISPQAIALAKSRTSARLTFFCEDMFLAAPSEAPDVLLVIDVFEHVPDYMGFVSKCQQLAEIKVYHIPLDIHVSSVLRNSHDRIRREIGHIHSFTASSAIATLKDTGHEILDQCYTNGTFGLFWKHPSAKMAIANVPRWLLSQFSIPFTARLLGGYSLLVLAK